MSNLTDPAHGKGGHEVVVTADPDLPIIHIERTFDATPAQLLRAHTDPNIVVKWLGPYGYEMTIDRWDARTGGEYRYIHVGDDGQFAFRGCFHEVSEDKLVQTFTYEDWPDSVSLETMTFEDLGDGRTKLHVKSLLDSMVSRDQMLASGMEKGVTEGYERLDGLLAADDL